MCTSVPEASIVRSSFKHYDHADAHRGTQRHGRTGHAAPVQITALSERTSGLDESLGSLLGDMRLALRMTPGELALRLGTTVDIIMTLEQGRLRALPHWEETQRVIIGLCAMHRVDPHPILQRIYEQARPTHHGGPPERGLGILQRAEEYADTWPPIPPAEPTTRRRTEPPAKRARRWKPRIGRGRGRALMAVAGPMVIVAAAVWTIQAQPRALRDSIEALPASISQPMLSGLDALAVRLAPRRDGLRWIDVSDPSSRKADKLEVGTR